MDALPHCPKCQSSYTYEDRGSYNCPECGHEWSAIADIKEIGTDSKVVRDANGTVLKDGDTVTVIKDLRAERIIDRCEGRHKNQKYPLG